MAHETVPVDIAAAIEELNYSAQYYARQIDAANGIHAMRSERALGKAKAALDAAILKHLRNADENKAALERIEQGV
jgi:hypothetical protein